MVPAYGVDTLAELLPSIGGRLRLPGAEDTLGLPDADRYVVLLVDGLGWDVLAARAERAPLLARLLETARPIRCGVPSTTSTSITSLGTGLNPGRHGVAGYLFRFGGGLLNALSWGPGVDGLDVQPQLTYLERLAKAGVAVSSVTPARFRASGLTACALRGARFFDVKDEDDLHRRAALVRQGALSGEHSLTYVYERRLDHTGHAHGAASRQWADELARVDRFVTDLRADLPDDVRIVVTGDHGMVDVPPDERLVLEDDPALRRHVALVGGEPRFRQLYCRPGTADDVAATWAETLGERAWVRTREQAVAEGWFGPMSGAMAPRFGDVLVAMRGRHAVMSHTQPNEFGLVGMHGSLTAAEMTVPVLIG